jgi:hypothetical protein
MLLKNTKSNKIKSKNECIECIGMGSECVEVSEQEDE